MIRRTIAIALVAILTKLAAVTPLAADENPRQDGNPRYLPGGRGATADRRPLWARRMSPVSQQKTATPSAETPRETRKAAVRPVTYGVRFSLGSMYPVAILGQTAQASPQPGAAYPAAPGASPGSASNINPEKYSFGGRTGVPYSCNMGNSPVYLSGYYTTGCYQTNACCRCSRRTCTTFGGMFRGCGPCCYSPPPPACPATCYGNAGYAPMGGVNYYAPPANGTPTPAPATRPAPTPAPTSPAPAQTLQDVEPPQPIERKGDSEPQAQLFPQIPGLPPDADDEN